MTISSNAAPKAGPFNGNGVQTVFPFTFHAFAKADLLVVSAVVVTGVQTMLVLDSNYSVTLNADQSANPGGSVTYPISGTPLQADSTLTIVSDIDYTQITDLINGGGFYPEVIEDSLDRGVMQGKQILEIVSRTLQVAISTPSNVNVTLPTPSALQLIGWNAAADGLVNYVPDVSSAAGLQVRLADSASSSNGDALLAVKTQATGATATTQHQVNEERTSVFQFMTAAQIAAISAEGLAAGAICSAALQAGLDGARSDGTFMSLNTYPHGAYLLDVPLRIKNGTPRMAIRGDSRIRALLAPSAVSIATAPVSINALIINQDNNPHFSLENVRFWSVVGFTGVMIYCVEGGGSDASGQCIFSGIFRNIFMDPPSTNGGFMTGATQNTVFDTITFENMKGCFNLVGAGSGDNFYKAMSLYNCYDQFILQTTDTFGSFAMSVDGLHAYSHNRGRLFDIQNWSTGVINDVSLEAAWGNLGTTGIGKFKSCVGLQMSNITASVSTVLTSTATVGTTTTVLVDSAGTMPVNRYAGFVLFNATRNLSALIVSNTATTITTAAIAGQVSGDAYRIQRAPACAVGLEFDSTSAKVTNGYINGDIGCRISGTGAVDLEFVNVDFSLAASAGFQIAANCTGTIRTRGCKFNDASIYGFVNQASSASAWYSYNDEFVNAGLGGNAASRNVAPAMSGAVVMFSPRIGRNSAAAVASYFIAGNGSGTFDIYDPIFVGTPPTGIIDPASTQVVNIHITQPSGVVRVSAATYTVLDSDRDIICNFAGTVTLTFPASGSSGAFFGRRINVRTVTANTVVSASSNVCPSTSLVPATAILAATAGKGAELVYEYANSVWQNQPAGN